jgi:hypothetical protein
MWKFVCGSPLRSSFSPWLMKRSAFNLMVLIAIASWTAGVSILAVGYGFAGLAVFSGPFSDSVFWRVGVVLTTSGTILAVLLPFTRRARRW